MVSENRLRIKIFIIGGNYIYLVLERDIDLGKEKSLEYYW